MRNKKEYRDIRAFEREDYELLKQGLKVERRLASAAVAAQKARDRFTGRGWRAMENVRAQLELERRYHQEALESEHRDNQAYIFMSLVNAWFLTPARMPLTKAYFLACRDAKRMHKQKLTLPEVRRRVARYERWAVKMARGEAL
ncbi:hypothetical protein [Victivallis vadensis]|uniref:hypothetical protein n=1 Tax=Victivallis vadensis TaxID=172901 RepID=UPI003AF5A790